MQLINIDKALIMQWLFAYFYNIPRISIAFSYHEAVKYCLAIDPIKKTLTFFPEAVKCEVFNKYLHNYIPIDAYIDDHWRSISACICYMYVHVVYPCRQYVAKRYDHLAVSAGMICQVSDHGHGPWNWSSIGGWDRGIIYTIQYI